MIDRALLLGNPARTNVQISPDGTQLSWLAAQGGVMNVWVAPLGDLGRARAVTADTVRPVRQYYWTYDNKHLLYLQDKGGDENFHVVAEDATTGKGTDLTPHTGARAEIIDTRDDDAAHAVADDRLLVRAACACERAQ